MSLNVGQVIARALRLLGELPGGVEASADIGVDMLTAANSMKRAWFGTLIGPRMSAQAFAASTASGQAENGGEYAVPGGAAFTVSAPLNPRAGARFGVIDGAGTFGTYACEIAGNGRLIGAASGALTSAAATTLSTNGAAARWWYRADLATWVLEQDWTAPTSAIEFPDPVIAYMPYMLAVVAAAEFDSDVPPEVAVGAQEGRQALARLYARRGPAGLDPVIGLMAAAPAQPAQGRG